MKRFIQSALFVLIMQSVVGQKTMFIHKGKIANGAPVSTTDSIYFSKDSKTAYFQMGDSTKLLFSHVVSTIDSITFKNNTDTVFITYNGTEVSVINPYAYQGVNVTVSNAQVTVNSTFDTRDVIYCLSGTSTNGYCKFYSNKRFNILLNGLTLTNTYGPAINIQANKKATVTLVAGKVNTLKDGLTYNTAPLDENNEYEDQKSTFFSEGQLIFEGTGTLNISSLSTHAIASDEYVEINAGNINVTSAIKNGIRTQEGFRLNGGVVTVASTGNNINGNNSYITITGGSITTTNTSLSVSAFKCDSTLSISGGTVNITLSGNNSHGLNSEQLVDISGGTVIVKNSGGVVLSVLKSGYDVSYSNGIKCDSVVSISGGIVSLTQTGAAGRGIVADNLIKITGGTTTITNSGNGAVYKDSTGTSDTYHAAGLKSKNDLNIEAGSVTITSSGSAGTGISVTDALTIGTTTGSPTLNITTTGAKITVATNNYDQAKAITSNNSVVINNGNVTISSVDDGIKSEKSTTFNGGNVTITTAIEGVEGPLITVNGGNIDVTATNDGFNGTYGTVSGGTESNDQSNIYFKGGYVITKVASGDALDANGNITVSGGTVIAVGPSSGVEEAADFNGSLNITGGTFFAAGSNSSMNKAMSSTSTQKGIFATTSSSVAANTIFRIQNSSGADMITYMCSKAQYSFLFSSPSLSAGSYSIYTGGTCTGTVKNGVYTGGTYSGGTAKKTFTISSAVTTTTF
ncbi:MAG: carbohydrate-binding domain-containing protein [Cytophagales bacterium]